MRVNSRTQDEAILAAISNLTELDTWDSKIIRIYFDADEGKWVTEAEEMIYTISYRKKLDKLTPMHYNNHIKKGVL